MKHKNIYMFNYFIKNRLLKNNFILCCHFVKSEKKVNNSLNLFVKNNDIIKIKLKNNFLKNLISSIFIKHVQENKLNINKGFKVYFFSNNLFVFVHLINYLKEHKLPIIPFTILSKNRQISIDYLINLYKKNTIHISNNITDPFKLSQKLIQQVFVDTNGKILNNFVNFSLISYKMVLYQLLKLIEGFRKLKK